MPSIFSPVPGQAPQAAANAFQHGQNNRGGLMDAITRGFSPNPKDHLALLGSMTPGHLFGGSSNPTIRPQDVPENGYRDYATPQNQSAYNTPDFSNQERMVAGAGAQGMAPSTMPMMPMGTNINTLIPSMPFAQQIAQQAAAAPPTAPGQGGPPRGGQPQQPGQPSQPPPNRGRFVNAAATVGTANPTYSANSAVNPQFRPPQGNGMNPLI